MNVELQVIRGGGGLAGAHLGEGETPPRVQAPSDAVSWAIVLGGSALIALIAWATVRVTSTAFGNFGW